MRLWWRVLLLLVLASLASSTRAGPICGDLDFDGDVDSADAGILRAEVAESAQMSLAQELACDVISEARAPGLEPDLADLAGRCSMSDAVVMQRAGAALSPGVAPVCAIGSPADCCNAHAGVGCSALETVACVCAQEPSCCTTEWSASCAALACTTACEPGCTANAVAAENCKSAADGVVDRSVWDVPGYQAASVCYRNPCPPYSLEIPSIEGFSTQFSVGPGETVQFKVNDRSVPPLPYSADDLSPGLVPGRGSAARRAAADPGSDDSAASVRDEVHRRVGASARRSEQFRDCSNWITSAQWTVPLDAVSGVYLAKFTTASGAAGHAIFVVREAPGAPAADLLYQLDDHTWQAYNDGGSDYGDWLYTPDGPRAVSYNRPFRNRYETVDPDRPHGAYHFFFEHGSRADCLPRKERILGRLRGLPRPRRASGAALGTEGLRRGRPRRVLDRRQTQRGGGRSRRGHPPALPR